MDKLNDIQKRNENDCLFYEDIKWLIERARKADELEIINKRLIRLTEGFIEDMKMSLNDKFSENEGVKNTEVNKINSKPTRKANVVLPEISESNFMIKLRKDNAKLLSDLERLK